MIPIQFYMPLRTVTGMNARELWQVRARRVQAERATTAGHLVVQCARRRNELLAALPLRITLTRVSPSAKWLPVKRCFQSCDDDAVPPALKGVRDEIASFLGLDDGDERLTFAYRQDKGARLAVRIRIEGFGEEAAFA